MTRVHITSVVFKAIQEIHEAGHEVSIENGLSGNSHTVVNIIIKVRHPDERGFVNAVMIKHTSSYSGQFSDFQGISPEFRSLEYQQFNDISPFLKVIDENLKRWRRYSTTPEWLSKMAKV